MAQPNILFIVSDQHRYDCIGFAGKKYPVKTPNLDRLACEGMFFDNAFTPIPVCSPARQAMLTGRMPDSYGALFNYDFIPVPSLRPDQAYWPKLLSQKGYQTAFIGKWHASKDFGAADFGYTDVYELSEHNNFIKEKYPEICYVNGWFGEESPVCFEDAQPHYLAGKVCSFIDRYAKDDAPWHIRLDLTVPHLPCRPSRPFSELYSPQDAVEWEGFGDRFEDKPYIQRQQLLNWNLENMSWDDWRESVSRYYAVVSQIDDAIGVIINALKNSGAYENTVVIYTSDHGDMCGSHGMIDKHYVLYDDVIRVPFIVSWPGKIKTGRIPEFVSNCLDLPATISDLAGLEPYSGHGRSIVPLLTGKEQNRPDFIVSASNGQQFGLYTQRSIRTKKWKYIWNLTDTDELYDLENDPGEKRSLIRKNEHSGILGELRKLLWEELRRLEDPFVKSGWLKPQLLQNKKLT